MQGFSATKTQPLELVEWEESKFIPINLFSVSGDPENLNVQNWEESISLIVSRA